jgi:(p)ppGpp synthase/HD superfamily hydrolase
MDVKEAAKFAVKAHGNQSYGGKPYAYHLEQVYKNTVKYGGSTTQQIAAWLHDVIEDTSTTKAEVSKEFGSAVATLVDLLSNRGSKETTYKRIRSSKDAVFVKLCDRLANVSAGAKNDMYRKQHPLFKSILYKSGEFDSLWKEIDRRLMPL